MKIALYILACFVALTLGMELSKLDPSADIRIEESIPYTAPDSHESDTCTMSTPVFRVACGAGELSSESTGECYSSSTSTAVTCSFIPSPTVDYTIHR